MKRCLRTLGFAAVLWLTTSAYAQGPGNCGAGHCGELKGAATGDVINGLRRASASGVATAFRAADVGAVYGLTQGNVADGVGAAAAAAAVAMGVSSSASLGVHSLLGSLPGRLPGRDAASLDASAEEACVPITGEGSARAAVFYWAMATISELDAHESKCRARERRAGRVALIALPGRFFHHQGNVMRVDVEGESA
ncbi:hypothetical protein [Rubrivivax gelatinosus]|uniref:hypothetical protein n=1 Tax=Rubrivivax gelatinosus TaxID=28068 RepID=UPI0005C1E20F|nr:hypothetical protein [Rubrivivax gelatinosus]MBG6083120.1 hypothetical protein [Rubrivivax gelatinosus]